MSKGIVTGNDLTFSTITAPKIRTDISFDRSPYVPLAAEARGLTARDGHSKEIVSDFDHVASNATINPGALFYDGKYLWTGGTSTGGTTQFLTQITLSTLTTSFLSLGTGNNVSGIAFDGTNIWVTTKNNLYKINRDANTIATTFTPVGFGTPIGGIIYDQQGHLYMARVSAGTGKIFKYDIAANVFSTITGTFLGTEYNFALDGIGHVFATSSTTTLSRITIATGGVDTIVDSGNTHSNILYDGSFLWWIITGSPHRAIWIDPATFTISGTVSSTLFYPTGGGSPGAPSVFDGNKIRFPTGVLDVRTHAVSAVNDRLFGVGDGFSALEYDGTYHWIVVVTAPTVGRVRRTLA